MIYSPRKPRQRLTALAMLISVIAVVPGSDFVPGHDADFLRWLPEVLDVLCPYSRTCRGGEPRLQLDEGMESCCTECSCEDDCGLTESCCYPEQAAKIYFDRSYQQCEKPSTMERSSNNFYMVTRGNGNEALADCGTANSTCGENETASVLGSLYPVSSKTTGVIYKNKQCARCHGVARSDMMHWKAVMTCPSVKKKGMDKYLQSLEMGRVHDSCFVDFYYPGPKSETDVHRCYENLRRSCQIFGRRLYHFPSLNMTSDEIRVACLTGPQAQYKQYYNIFCFQCNHGVYNQENQCKKTYMGGRTDSPGSFAALLDSSYFEQKSLAKRLNSETKAQIPIACKRGQNGAEIDADDCRPALCPTGKVRLDAACVYHTETLFTRKFRVAINLFHGDNRNVNPLVDYLTSHLQQGKDWRALISAPGLGSWRLSDLCYHKNTQPDIDNGLTGFAWLRVTLENDTSPSFAKLLASVNKFMTEGWTFLFNMTSVRLDRNFSEFEDVKNYKLQHMLYPENVPPASILYWPGLSCIVRDPNDPSFNAHNPGLTITKTFFCKQIALQPGEYFMDRGSKAVYVNATGRVFTPVEYSLGYGASGEPEPRLCLEDTDYVLKPHQDSASPIAVNWPFLTMTMLVNLKRLVL